MTERDESIGGPELPSTEVIQNATRLIASFKEALEKTPEYRDGQRSSESISPTIRFKKNGCWFNASVDETEKRGITINSLFLNKLKDGEIFKIEIMTTRKEGKEEPEMGMICYFVSPNMGEGGFKNVNPFFKNNQDAIQAIEEVLKEFQPQR